MGGAEGELAVGGERWPGHRFEPCGVHTTLTDVGDVSDVTVRWVQGEVDLGTTGAAGAEATRGAGDEAQLPSTSMTLLGEIDGRVITVYFIGGMWLAPTDGAARGWRRCTCSAVPGIMVHARATAVRAVAAH